MKTESGLLVDGCSHGLIIKKTTTGGQLQNNWEHLELRKEYQLCMQNDLV